MLCNLLSELNLKGKHFDVVLLGTVRSFLFFSLFVCSNCTLCAAHKLIQYHIIDATEQKRETGNINDRHKRWSYR